VGTHLPAAPVVIRPRQLRRGGRYPCGSDSSMLRAGWVRSRSGTSVRWRHCLPVALRVDSSSHRRGDALPAVRGDLV